MKDGASGLEGFRPRLQGKTIVIFVDFQFEDLEVRLARGREVGRGVWRER